MVDDRLGQVGEGLAAHADADPTEVAEMYDDWAAAYDADLARWDYRAPVEVAGIVAGLLTRRDVPILDAGCGTGLSGTALRERGFENIVGGDFSAASVDTARSQGVYTDVGLLDLNGPIDHPDERFGAVVSVGVFSYLTDSEATIRELLRIVEPGGPIVFTQRTDLWEERSFGDLLDRLAAEGSCRVDVSDRQPYLPGHPEFGDDIGIFYVTLTKPAR